MLLKLLYDLKLFILSVFSSVQFSRSAMSDSLWPHESQHARPPCPSATPGVHSDSRPSSQWCHPAISSSVLPFSSCPQSLSASESFPMSQLFAWGGHCAIACFYGNDSKSVGYINGWKIFWLILYHHVKNFWGSPTHPSIWHLFCQCC